MSAYSFFFFFCIFFMVLVFVFIMVVVVMIVLVFSGYDVGVCVYDGGSGCGFFFLFHKFTKVQFIFSNAVI